MRTARRAKRADLTYAAGGFVLAESPCAQEPPPGKRRDGKPKLWDLEANRSEPGAAIQLRTGSMQCVRLSRDG